MAKQGVWIRRKRWVGIPPSHRDGATERDSLESIVLEGLP